MGILTGETTDWSSWDGKGPTILDLHMPDLSASDIARYVAPGWHIDPSDGRPVMNAQLPPGWRAGFGTQTVGVGDGSSEVPALVNLQYSRPDIGPRAVDVYFTDGRYWHTSLEDSTSGVFEWAVETIVIGGVTAGIGEVISVASAGGLASQAVDVAGQAGNAYTAVDTATQIAKGSDVATTSTSALDYWDGDITADLYTDFPDLYTNAPTAPAFDIPDVSGDGLDYWDADIPRDMWADLPDPYANAPTGPQYPIPDVQIASTPPIPASVGGSLMTIIGDAAGAAVKVSTAVLATAQAINAFKGGVQPATRTTVANPNNGLVNGVRPAAGVLTMTPGGGGLINNGDGTYTVINPDGSSVTRAYGTGVGVAGGTGTGTGTIAGINTQTLLVAALGIGAVMLLQPGHGSRSTPGHHRS